VRLASRESAPGQFRLDVLAGTELTGVPARPNLGGMSAELQLSHSPHRGYCSGDSPCFSRIFGASILALGGSMRSSLTAKRQLSPKSYFSPIVCPGSSEIVPISMSAALGPSSM